MAWWGGETKIPIVLARPTPSVETVVTPGAAAMSLEAAGAVRRQHLPSVEASTFAARGRARAFHFAAALPKREESRRTRRSRRCCSSRRGFAPLTLCNACGHRMACPIADALAGRSSFQRRLVCTIAARDATAGSAEMRGEGQLVAVGPASSGGAGGG